MSHWRIIKTLRRRAAWPAFAGWLAARLALEALFFAAFVFAVFIAAKESGKGRWFINMTDVWSLFAWGPALAICAFFVASRFTATANQVSRWVPLMLALASLAAVGCVALEAMTRRHGLWREWTAMDNHFSNSLQRGYYFASWVGGAGVLAAFTPYLAVRLTFAAPQRFSPGFALICAGPYALWLSILARQLWVPAPYFLG